MIQVLVSAQDRDDLVAPIQGAVEATVTDGGFDQAEISVALLGDAEMRGMNRDHLGHDYTTDVISFGLWDEGEPVVGDIYIGLDQAIRQAADAGVDADAEVLRLAVHGSLHVLGWDHPASEEDRADSEMYQRQEAILERLSARGTGA